jgi:hypothetical protein
MTAQTFNQALELETSKRIDEAVCAAKNTLAAGQLPDHATYKYHAGTIAGLEKAKELLMDALRDMQRV